MKKILGIVTCLLLLSAAGSVLQARDRYRDRRDLRRDVQVFVSTPYGGGYFVRGNPYATGYLVPRYRPYLDKRARKRYYKELKRTRRGFVRYDPRYCDCRYGR